MNYILYREHNIYALHFVLFNSHIHISLVEYKQIRHKSFKHLVPNIYIFFKSVFLETFLLFILRSTLFDYIKISQNYSRFYFLSRETLLSETDRNYNEISRTLLTEIWKFPLKIVNVLIFIDNRLEIGKTA